MQTSVIRRSTISLTRRPARAINTISALFLLFNQAWPSVNNYFKHSCFSLMGWSQLSTAQYYIDATGHAAEVEIEKAFRDGRLWPSFVRNFIGQKGVISQGQKRLTKSALLCYNNVGHKGSGFETYWLLSSCRSCAPQDATAAPGRISIPHANDAHHRKRILCDNFWLTFITTFDTIQ